MTDLVSLVLVVLPMLSGVLAAASFVTKDERHHRAAFCALGIVSVVSVVLTVVSNEQKSRAGKEVERKSEKRMEVISRKLSESEAREKEAEQRLREATSDLRDIKEAIVVKQRYSTDAYLDADEYIAAHELSPAAATELKQANRVLNSLIEPGARSACISNDIRSCHKLAQSLSEENPTEAARIYDEACAANFGWSCQNLGMLYLKSALGHDVAKAAEYFSKGCALKDRPEAWGRANADAAVRSCRSLKAVRKTN